MRLHWQCLTMHLGPKRKKITLFYCGPNRVCALYAHNGPTWAFPKFSVHCHMGSTNNYVLLLLHGLSIQGEILTSEVSVSVKCSGDLANGRRGV
jgi:hypothetical protein